ncbi:hypothetical protein [Actinocrispum wychmicini]|uniref:hypothetical protein n=1 Tax=Actinocrispum wychmicini TaxID=1213861 RepID=UPI001052325A|nr:hypothetical protein [Actinocrispum wychmicini]
MFVTALLLLSGCTSQVSGAPAATRPGPGSAAELLGDAGTVDSCSLLDPTSLDQFGTAQPQPQESYDYCWLRLPMSDAQVAVRFGLLERVRSLDDVPARQIELVGPLRILEASPVPDRCARYIFFIDNITLAVSADTADSPNTTVSSLCSVTEKATHTIAQNIVAKKIEHHAYPPSSFGPLDACKAVVTTLGQIPGLAAAETTAYPAHHQCRWGTATVPSLTLRYVLSAPSAAANVHHETIAGRTSGVYTVDINGPTLCVAEVAGIGRELAQVIVRTAPGTTATACAAARIVAGEVWSKLPVTS